MTGIELIAQERKEQIEKHGFSIEKDKQFNDNGEALVDGAVALLTENSAYFPADWDKDLCVRMSHKAYKERLIIAGALIAAALDAIQE